MNESLNIVVVEDDQTLNELIILRLKKENHQCLGFTNSTEAFEWLIRNHADLLIIDLMLPDYRGDELVEMLAGKQVKIPFIVATGKGSEDIAVQMLKKGARDYLVKNSGFLSTLPGTVENVWREVKLEKLLDESRKLVEEQNVLLSAIHQLSPDGIMVFDTEHKIVSCNQKLLEIFGLDSETRPENGDEFLRHIASGLDNKDIFLEKTLFVNRNFSGLLMEEININDACYELYTIPLVTAGNDKSGRIWYFRDITIHKEAEREKEIARLEAEQNVKARSQFFAVVSHDVKAPLNSMIGFISLLENSLVTEEQKRYIGIIKASGEHLFMLINDILDMTKIERGSFEFTPCRAVLIDLIEQCLNIFAPVLRESGIKLESEIAEDVPAIITTDIVRLKQIIINLLSNAMKFTHQGYVKVKVRRRDEDFLEFEISDTGTGIPQEVQELIFSPFTQGSSEVHNKYGGSGLGLAISKQIVERFGGEISLTSSVGNGSTFIFSIPVDFSSPKAIRNKPAL